MSAWFAAFVWTLAVEGLVLEVALGHRARSWSEPLLWCLCLNLATHPLFSWWVLERSPTGAEIAMVEVAIAAVEAVLLGLALRARLCFLRPAAVAALANATSYAFGLFVLEPLWR